MSKFKVGDKVTTGSGIPASIAGISADDKGQSIYALDWGADGIGGFVWTDEELELVKPVQNSVSDSVNHPAHYSSGLPEGIQVVDIIRAQGADFFHGNVIKYILRWQYKNGVEDLKKAQKYLSWLIEQEEAKNV